MINRKGLGQCIDLRPLKSSNSVIGNMILLTVKLGTPCIRVCDGRGRDVRAFVVPGKEGMAIKAGEGPGGVGKVEKGTRDQS